MAFKKGDKKPIKSGIKKGGKQVKTKAWEELGDFLTDVGAEKAKQIMLNAPPEKFMLYYTMFIEYFKPKRARVDENGETAQNVITVIEPE